MDLMDVRPATPASNKKRCARKRNRVWRKRFRRKKRAPQIPTMQREAQNGPKKIPEKCEQSTEWPSSKKPALEAPQSECWTNNSINALRFTCTQCKSNLEYVPKDLVRHFEENHRGSPPVFSCHMCSFNTHKFSYLQVHLLSHKDTFSSCSICNDNVKRTWSELCTHLTTRHCQNGKYSCELCHRFTTGDVTGFLEHLCVQHFGLQRVNEIDLHKKDNIQLGSITTNQTLCCPHCNYEASQKWKLAKHVNANHRQNGNQRKEGVRSVARKSKDPQTKQRLTRSAVRDMCWLRQDCLSLPGRDFLDKYCHLSDPQNTLEETQQFLMKSVAGDKGDQKWTKALKSVLSNVPQDISIHSKSENGIMSDSADLTVLTVQNKITVAQNGATYAKRLKMMEETEKECHFPEGAAAAAAAAAGQNGGQVIVNDDPRCLQGETKLSEDALILTHSDPPKCIQILENRENQELKADLDKHKQPHVEGNGTPDEPLIVKESQDEKCVDKERPKNKRRKRKSKSKKKTTKGTSGLALKIVLKKNPVKGRQWVSQSPSDASPMEDQHTKPVQDATQNTSEAITSARAPTGTGRPPLCAAKDSFLPHVGKWDDAKESLHISEAHLDKIGPSNPTATSVEACPDGSQHPPSSGVPDSRVSADDGATHGRYSMSPPPSQPTITQQGMINPGEVRLADHVREVPPDSCPNLLSNADPPMEKAIQRDPWPGYGCSRPVPKNLERTLKLIAISPSQLIRRPVRDQPVVVLNHPDADIPEVAKIMEVVNRYKGEVRKVILSRSTLNALSVTNDPGDHPTQLRPPWHGENFIQERFTLKLRLRRLGRKKYEVLDPISPGRDVAKKFSCWFCGRIFEKQEVWMVHRQRHLMDWKTPNCENV
uniref:zinc finger protein 518A n=1 Tax=Doryrhamphus excisus TaxID=161450 RepID=UPI0025AEA64D|nr:zinc finger protein 518A [Doryrhamphus excisus]XP_057920133.1 zinc finger protein 518A [Doryrhamphus excisus]